MASRETKDLNQVMEELIRRVNEDRRRIRLVEQNIDRIEGGLSSLEETLLSQMGDIKVTLDRINNKLGSVSDRIDVVESDISGLNKRMGKSATKTELKQIESFIDLVNPVTSKFVTKDELERAFEDRVKRKV